ncbi:MAG: RnfH family protein [Lysobacterales bacterium]
MSTDSDSATQTISVEVAHATPDKQIVLRLEMAAGSTVAEAIEQSGIRSVFPGLVIAAGAVGIFSRKVPLDHMLRMGDRVEIYRPLIADPKEVRRERASRAAGR